MRISSKQTISENLLYFMVWAAIILVPVLNSKMMSEIHVNLANILIAWRKIAPYLIIFLVHNSLIAPRFVLTHRYIWYVVLDLTLIVGVFWLVDLYDRHLIGPVPADANLPIGPHTASFSDLELYWNVILGLFMTGANAGIKLMYQSIRDEQEMEALKRQNLQAEMDYLKYQINPHFFMNTLNNIHALIDIDTESAKETVIELSKMMRYVLYDSGRDRIPLEKELQFIENYIELMRIRYAGEVDLRVRYPRPLPAGVDIPPLLLIVFVENAFKHGVSNNRPSYIHIDVECSDGWLVGTFTNSRHPNTSTQPAGIGLENVRKRLELIYGPRKHSLLIDDTDPTTYRVKLIIPTTHS